MKRRRSSSGKTPKVKKFKPYKPDDGITRKVGFYGRYGRAARMRGVQPELKFFDTSLAFSFDQTGNIPATGQLCLIPQGDTESTRDGRKAWIKSIQIRGNITYVPSTSPNGTDTVFLYVILDSQCNGNPATITEVFTSADMWSNMLQLNNSGRFRILKKWELPIASRAGVSAAFSGDVKQISWYKRCNIPIDWNGTTGALTEIRSNNIFLAAGSLRDIVSTMAGTCRLRFQG